jgi:hypothetical protein
MITMEGVESLLEGSFTMIVDPGHRDIARVIVVNCSPGKWVSIPILVFLGFQQIVIQSLGKNRDRRNLSCIDVPNHLLNFILRSKLVVVIHCKGIWETCIGVLSWKG